MKNIIKRLNLLICWCLVAICALSTFIGNKESVSTPTRDVELVKQDVDYQAYLSNFEKAKLIIEDTVATFSGYKTYNLKDFAEIDMVSATQVDNQITVKYIANYDDKDCSVSLTAIINGNGETIEDTVYGVAFINEEGTPDAIMDFDGEYILLSELQNIGVIENCGWFKKLVTAAIATVVVTVVVASVMATGGATLGAVVGVCALVGAGVGGTTSAIVGAIDGEVSFGQICANFGAGLIVGAATGALTGFVVGKIACYNVAFSKGSFGSVDECISYHFRKHGAEVGASNVSEYLKIAMDTARNVIKSGTAPIRAVAGATANVMRYEIGNYYIHMAIEGTKFIIVSFGLM